MWKRLPMRWWLVTPTLVQVSFRVFWDLTSAFVFVDIWCWMISENWCVFPLRYSGLKKKNHYVLLSNNIFIGSRLCEHSGWELASTKPGEARAHRGKQGQWRLLKVYFSRPWVYLYLENNPEKMWHNVTFYFSAVLGLWAGVDVSLCGAVREQQLSLTSQSAADASTCLVTIQ